MRIGTYIFEWLHILSAIIWFGGVLFMGMVVAPAMQALPPRKSAFAFSAMDARITRVLLSSGWATVILGTLRGTVFGRIKSFDALFETRYGMAFTAALVLGLITILIGQFVVSPAAHALSAMMVKVAESDAGPPPEGAGPPPEAKKVETYSKLITLLMLVIFTLMVVLNFS